MDPRDEFNRNMQKLMVLLQKIVRSQKNQPALDFNELLHQKKQVNLNLFFFTFLPLTPEEMEELEESFEDFFFGESGGARTSSEPELRFELSPRDLDFLKNNGISF